ncbi:Murein tetrapeptide carboxypeptidase [Paraburkholderia domus]|jgi:muramoyltetrapeptide carboxypeptidase|uniref:Murein tetrapeptide carboxypeptidase n=1 Tax=Paraburkholderia domus TaxID=2793075 RepID=A0A9N8QYF2_9BURK|nr:muramoyltetrapeptide carboxypeptidase [Paraburkholderia domus]MBK5048456.1 muramoyltetrapeptide carboxypeptidase [Burkholderia sp. R-70006]MBK5060955.1 muramoyltetrapeptide carboxypeptidase [Burkholderia sp. R-70199]MBK5085967.1 muramoyltetrapeptide carboxypeptidase [Burkholderia sp. R-69927]MBK5120449.1 muramoyltetrapeptide carboxypeptidase [Burkholderia sp. R-69980]MBK5166153.1 muramoyltetrapeptide carboxypeptidase [Burkholderia sp. R-70211]MBK5185052.1 muramoyltetrapeptide carboxypeptid
MTVHRTIELIAPSGYPHDSEALHRALHRLHAQGHRVEGVEATRRRYQRFAGTDGERAADLNRLADPSRALPDIVLAVRGGYGAARILHGLDYDGLQRRLTDQPIALVGHSDFTAVQLALLARAGVKTFGGPMLISDFGAEDLSEFTMQHFWSALTTPTMTVASNVPQAQTADVTGMLWGGNLAVVASLIGTPYMPPVQGGILFVEDVNEQPFRLERMLYQLHLSGILAQQQALVLGDFSGGKSYEYDNGYDLHTMIEQVRSVIGIPVITGLQFGHVPNMLTLPVGADAHLVSDAHGFRLTVSDYPHLA